MNDNVKELINELKGIVMRLHRSAGNLDMLIQCLEDQSITEGHDEYLNVLIKTQLGYREAFKKYDIEDIDKDELTIWNALIQITEKKEP